VLFHRLRKIICQATEDEVHQSNFRQLRSLRLGGKVCAKVIPNVKGRMLKTIMDNKILPDSIVYSNTLSASNVLDVSDCKHYRINHSKRFADKKNHITGSEISEARPSARAQIQRCSEEEFSVFLRTRVAVQQPRSAVAIRATETVG
jgi:transposase-like protein